MSFLGNLEIETNQFTVLKFTLRLNQTIDQNNRPNGAPSGGVFNITIESSNKADLLEWMLSHTMMKTGQLTFSRRDAQSSMRTVRFIDAFCVGYNEHFDSVNDKPMQIDLTISARLLKFGGSLEVRNQWPGNFNDGEDSSSSSNTVSSSSFDDIGQTIDNVRERIDETKERINEEKEKMKAVVEDVKQEIQGVRDEIKEVEHDVKKNVSDAGELLNPADLF